MNVHLYDGIIYSLNQLPVSLALYVIFFESQIMTQ